LLIARIRPVRKWISRLQQIRLSKLKKKYTELSQKRKPLDAVQDTPTN
jgi:hypothetical protein